VVSCRGTAEKVKPISEPNRKDQLRKLFSKVDAIHCVSQDMASTIHPFCNQPDKIFVNRPSIDPAVFKRAKPYAQPGAVLQIFTIGRFTFQKGYLIGLMAMHKLKSLGVQFKWKIVGDGPLKEEMLYHIHALQLQDCVELVGKKNRDEILELYNNTDVFLLPSVYEGIANVCLEAMSMELPVVSTKSGGMEEVIVHGENGLLCEVYDVDSIAENVKWLTQNPGLLKGLGVNARKTIIERFTISRQVDVFEEQYANLIKQ
jgi:colanic acid/amylovoran biosynthesis glycosyltransferase